MNGCLTSVWKSDEKLLIFASLISLCKIILFEKQYQAFDTVFHHQMKHLEVRQKYSAARRIFHSLLGVSSSDETLHLMLDMLHPLFSNFTPPPLFAENGQEIIQKCQPFNYGATF